MDVLVGQNSFDPLCFRDLAIGKRFRYGPGSGQPECVYVKCSNHGALPESGSVGYRDVTAHTSVILQEPRSLPELTHGFWGRKRRQGRIERQIIANLLAQTGNWQYSLLVAKLRSRLTQWVTLKDRDEQYWAIDQLEDNGVVAVIAIPGSPSTITLTGLGFLVALNYGIVAA